jgi:uncharacterized membrane protein
MKAKKTMVIGSIVFATLLIFLMTTCDNGSTDGGGGGNAAIGAKLNLSGQVYMQDYDYDDGTLTYTPYSGTALTVPAPFTGAGTGTISVNGVFAFNNIGTPPSGVLEDIQTAMTEGGDSQWTMTVSDTSAKVFAIDSFQITSDSYDHLSKQNLSYSINGTSVSSTSESVTYIYTDKDVVLRGTGSTITETETYGGMTMNMTYTYKSFNIQLEAGWNALHLKATSSQKMTGTTMTVTGTVTISGGDANLKWVLDLD